MHVTPEIQIHLFKTQHLNISISLISEAIHHTNLTDTDKAILPIFQIRTDFQPAEESGHYSLELPSTAFLLPEGKTRSYYMQYHDLKALSSYRPPHTILKNTTNLIRLIWKQDVQSFRFNIKK